MDTQIITIRSININWIWYYVIQIHNNKYASVIKEFRIHRNSDKHPNNTIDGDVYKNYIETTNNNYQRIDNDT